MWEALASSLTVIAPGLRRRALKTVKAFATALGKLRNLLAGHQIPKRAGGIPQSSVSGVIMGTRRLSQSRMAIAYFGISILEYAYAARSLRTHLAATLASLA